jgi:hypothetical protein
VDVRRGLEVDGDHVGARAGEGRDVPLRALDHEMYVGDGARS